MTDTLSNYLKFHDDQIVDGNIATLTYDVNLIGEKLTSNNPKAPLHRLYGYSPKGRKVQIGCIWQQKRKDGTGTYLTLEIDTGSATVRANLGKYPGQDDENLMAIIPWEKK